MYHKKTGKDNNKKRSWGKIIFRIVVSLFVLGVISVIGVFAYFAKDLPNPNKVNKRVIAQSTKIYDRTGQHLLYEIHGEEKRTLIPFNQMGDNIKNATIVLEDKDFYYHHGIKLTSIMRAMLKDVLKRGAAQGGSTITQQLVKNSILTRERTMSRKIKEVILSFEIEQKFSKDEILKMYLNEIPYGSNAYGIEAAAKTFFGKSARDLTIDEAALLASLPKAPTYYSPFGSHRDRLKSRQEMAINSLAELGYISKEEAENAKQIDIFKKIVVRQENMQAPHFVMYVKEYLDNKYGEQEMKEGGLSVYTTLDWDKQQIAEKVVKEGAEKNLKKWNAENAALVAIDAKTGQILAMVGSKDYFDKSIDGQVNVALSRRQPGSSFKPYVYLTAFTKGYLPETILYDVETDFNKGSDDDYIPQNYDGKFRGPVKMQEALGMSLNVPAVKTLYLVGVKDAIKMAKDLGITGLNYPDRYGLSLVLGGGEVRLLDHTNAFATLADGGIKHNKTAILRIEDKDKKIIEEFKDNPGDRVVEEKYVAMLDYIISNNKFRAPAFGEQNPLRFDNRQVVAKTGTTNEFRDGWTMGYTPSIAVGVWAGNNDNSPMKPGAAGANVASPIWRSFMDSVLENYNTEEFPKYDEEEVLKEVDKPILKGDLDIKKKVEVCEIPGEKNKWCLASKYCPNKERKKKTFVEAHNILWYVDKKDPRGDIPKHPEKDAQFNRWEEAVQKWYKKNKKKKYILDSIPEKECRENDFTKYKPDVDLNVSKQNIAQLKISADSKADYGVDSIKIYVDGHEIGSTGSSSISLVYDVPAEKNNSTLKITAKLKDENGNETDDSQNVNISF